MRKGRILFSLGLIVLGAFAVHAAWGWTFQARLFPLTVSIPLIVLAAAQLLLDLFGRAETASGPAVELEFESNVPSAVARRRVTGILLWIAGFILLVFLLGFPVAIPLFMFFYLRLQGEAGWWQSLGLTAAAWGFFHVLFQRLVNLPFEAGVVQTWFGM